MILSNRNWISRTVSRPLVLLILTGTVASSTLLSLSGCGDKEESQKGPDGKPHFNHGPGLSAEDLAKANAYRQQQTKSGK